MRNLINKLKQLIKNKNKINKKPTRTTKTTKTTKPTRPIVQYNETAYLRRRRNSVSVNNKSIKLK